MRGILLVEHKNGKRSIYVPLANIQIFVDKFEKPEAWHLRCFRTDGQRVLEWEHVPGGIKPVKMIPVVEYLKQTCTWTAPIELPGHIVAFAIESECRRRDAIDAFTGILENTVKSGSIKKGLSEFLQELGLQKQEEAELELSEERVAKEVLMLIRDISGGGFN